jgi:PAS domain S-box-containing protein
MTIKDYRHELSQSADMTDAQQAGSLRLNAVKTLRRQAEEIATESTATSPKNLSAMSPEETLRTLHELRVHQIELEMQNEEMKRTQLELSASRDQYFNFYDLSPVGYFTLSEKGLILESNLTTATLLGLARCELIKKPISRFIHKEDEDIYYLHRKQPFDAVKQQPLDLRMMKNDGTVFWAHLATSAAQSAEGEPVYRIVMSDITKRKLMENELKEARKYLEKKVQERTRELQKTNEMLTAEIEKRMKFEETLQESQVQYRLLSEHTTDAVWMMDMNLNITYHSPTVK